MGLYFKSTLLTFRKDRLQALEDTSKLSLSRTERILCHMEAEVREKHTPLVHLTYNDTEEDVYHSKNENNSRADSHPHVFASESI